MIRSPSDTSNSATTPVPFSPFSSAFSIGSDHTGTSEEPGDLGAFGSIFRALNQLQRQPPSAPPSEIIESSDHLSSESDDPVVDASFRSSSSSSSESEVPNEFLTAKGQNGGRSTVWNQTPVASYLTTTSRSDLEDETDGVPSLGALESALMFLARERSRLTIKLDHAFMTDDATSAGEASAPIKTKATRRGKNKRRNLHLERLREAEAAVDGDESRTETVAELSSSYESHDDMSNVLNPSSITPIFRQSTKSRFSKKPPRVKLAPSSTVPALSSEAQVLKTHLTSLALRLSEQFPSDARVLRSMTFDTDRLVAGAASFALSGRIEKDGFYDPRHPGSVAMAENAKVHVFVDHSNILVGFLEWVKQQSFNQPSKSSISIPGSTWAIPKPRPSKAKLSHAALILLLERGRTCGRRVLVASSPLHQGVDDVVEMGYEVSVLQRVAIKEGVSASSSNISLSSGGRKTLWAPDSDRRSSQQSYQTAHSNGSHSQNGQGASTGSGGSSTESGQGVTGKSFLPMKAAPGHRRYPSAPSAFPLSSHSPSSSALAPTGVPVSRPPPNPFAPSLGFDPTNIAPPSPSSSSSGMPPPFNPPTSRPRFREEAVDELLQLKLLQVLVSTPDKPPRGSTIVLATGDGASSQFNRDGFVGCVRQAVERGWRVELVGWEEGRSRAWIDLSYEIQRRKANGTLGRSGGGLHMISLEKWGWDLYDSSMTA